MCPAEMEADRLLAEVERLRGLVERVRDQAKSTHFRPTTKYVAEALTDALRGETKEGSDE